MITGIWPLLIISCVAAQIRDDDCDTLYECWTLSNGAKVAWRTMADSPGDVDIQMTRPDSGDYSNSQYAALGWSTDAVMGDDAVTECVFTGDQAQVFLSFNNGKSNVRLPVDIANQQVQLVESRRSDGQLYCRVKQRIQAIQDVQGVYDLNREYNLLFAMGEASATNIKQHQFREPFNKLVDVTTRQFPNAPPTGPVAGHIPGMPPPPPPPLINRPLDGNLPPIPPLPSGLNETVPLTPPSLPGTRLNLPTTPQSEPEPEQTPESELSDNTVHGSHDTHSEPEGDPHSEPEHTHSEPEPETNNNSVTGTDAQAESEPSAEKDNGAVSLLLSASLLCMMTLMQLWH